MTSYYPPRKKQQIFFVDTKTTCFLCLQEIVQDLRPSTMSMISLKDDYLVKLKLQESKIEKQEPFCLRSIFKLLQLDPGRVISKKLPAGPFLGSNLKNTDLSVVLCKTCLHVTTQLSSLFSDLEQLQMKLDYAVQNFAKILQISESDPNHMAELRKKLIDPLEMLQGSVTELIRKETLQRCMERIKKLIPKVDMSQAKNTVISSTVNVTASAPVVAPILTSKAIKKTNRYQCCFCSAFRRSHWSLSNHIRSSHPESSKKAKTFLSQLGKHTCRACGRKFDLKSSLQRHEKTNCKFRMDAPTNPKLASHTLSGKLKYLESSNPPLTNPPAVSTLTKLLSSMPRIKVEDEDTTELLLCGLCPSHNGKKFSEEDKLKKHVFTHHLNYFFPSVKFPECSKVKFRKLCATLFKELQSRIIESQPDSDGNDVVFNCFHCSNQCHDKWTMYTHMVEDHSNIYACKLMELHRSNDSNNVGNQDGNKKRSFSTAYHRANTTFNAPQSERYKCHGCKRVYSKYSSYVSHKRSIYCATSASTYTSSENTFFVSKPFCCNNCGKSFFSRSGVWRHQKRCCTMSPPGSGNSCPPSRKKTKNFPSKAEELYHKEFHCSNRLRPAGLTPTDLKNLPSDTAPESCPPFRCKKCGRQFSARYSMFTHMIYSCRFRFTGPPKYTHAQQSSTQPPPTSLSAFATNGCIDCESDYPKIGLHKNSKKIPKILRPKKTPCPHQTHDSLLENKDISIIYDSPSAYKGKNGNDEFHSPSSNLQEHVASLHRNKRKARPDGRTSGTCECGVYFTDLSQHIRLQTCSAHPKPAITDISARAPETVTVATTSKFPCEYCGNTLASASGLFRHQKDNCALAKTAVASVTRIANQSPLSSIAMTVIRTQDIFFDENEEEAEEESVDFKQGSYLLNTEIQMLEPSPMQLFRGSSSDAMMSSETLLTGDYSEVSGVENQDCTTMFPVDQENDDQKVENTMMILPDDEEPES